MNDPKKSQITDLSYQSKSWQLHLKKKEKKNQSANTLSLKAKPHKILIGITIEKKHILLKLKSKQLSKRYKIPVWIQNEDNPCVYLSAIVRLLDINQQCENSYTAVIKAAGNWTCPLVTSSSTLLMLGNFSLIYERLVVSTNLF